jgi:hypothetical protein
MSHHGTEVSVAAWPVVVIRVGESLATEAIECMLEGMDGVVRRREKFSLIIDTRKLRGFPDANGRARFGAYMKQNTFAEAAYNCGNAVIVASATARAVLTAIHWFRPPVIKYGYFGTFEESLGWCCERLREANIAFSPSLEKLRRSPGQVAL